VHGITGHNFETRHPSDDSDQVWFPLVLYFQKRRFLKKFTTYDDDGRQVMAKVVKYMLCTQKQKTFYGTLEIDSMNTPTKLVFNRPKGFGEEE
jgi:hypothetical protein